MRVLVVHDRPGFEAHISYVFDLLLGRALGMDYEIVVHSPDAPLSCPTDDCVIILYGDDGLNTVPGRFKLHIYGSDLFGASYLTEDSLPATPLDWIQYDATRVPVLYRAHCDLSGSVLLTTERGDPLVTRAEQGDGQLICTGLDLVASSFFMLSRYEEALIKERDQFERFPLEANLAFQEGFWRTPVVNCYADLLGDWITGVTDGGLAPQPPSYPDNHPFGLCLTHDVDQARKFTPVGLLKTFAKAVLGRETPKALRQIRDYVLGRGDPFWSFETIVAWEHRHGFSSTFFLAAGRQHERDPAYADDPIARTRLCQTISNLGAEIGLHGSFESYADTRVLKDEWVELSRCATVTGCRQHYLRLDIERSFAAMEEAGLRYDSTLAFSREIGFRSGLASPHRVFSAEKNRSFRVMEIPLVAMDRSLWTIAHARGIPPEVVWEDLLQVLDRVRKHHGCVSVLWHNGFFDDAAYPGYGELYHRLLRWLHENGGWGTSGRDVYDWFVSRQER